MVSERNLLLCKHAYYMLGALPTLSFTSWRELYHWIYFTSKTKVEETLSNFPNHIQDRDSISDGFKLRSEAMSTSFPCTTLLQSHCPCMVLGWITIVHIPELAREISWVFFLFVLFLRKQDVSLSLCVSF